jgi:hypothetical protein
MNIDVPDALAVQGVALGELQYLVTLGDYGRRQIQQQLPGVVADAVVARTSRPEAHRRCRSDLRRHFRGCSRRRQRSSSVAIVSRNSSGLLATVSAPASASRLPTSGMRSTATASA